MKIAENVNHSVNHQVLERKLKTKWTQRWRCSFLVILCNILTHPFADNDSGTFEKVLYWLLIISILSWYEEKDTSTMKKNELYKTPKEVKYIALFEFFISFSPCCPPSRWRGKLQMTIVLELRSIEVMTSKIFIS